MRKITVAIGIILLVVIVAVAILAATFNVNKYRGTIQSQLEKRLDRSVTLGEMQLKLFPPRFGVQDLAIADDPHFSPDSPFVKAKELDVSVKLLPLLHKEIEIDSLNLERPNVNLIKNQAGQWNFASIGHEQNPQRPNSTQQQFSLGELTIKDGQVSLLDQTQSRTPTLYDHIDLTVANFSMKTPFTVDAAVHMAGTGEEALRFQGQGGPIAEQDLTKTPLQGTLELKQVGLSDLTKFFNSPAVAGTDGVMTGQTKVSNDHGKVIAQGETNIQNARVRGMELGYPISVQYDLTDDLPTEVITMRKLTVKLGPTPIEMAGTLETKSSPAHFNVSVRANNISVAEAAKFAAASGIALSQGTIATGAVNANIQITGAVDKPALTGTVTGTNLQMSGKDVAQPIQIQSVNLNLSPTEIRSNPFNVLSGNTAVNTQFTMRNYLSPSPIVDATVKAPNAQLPAILAIAKAYGVTSLDKVNGDGTLTLDMHASGPVKSLSVAEIEKAMDGTINLNFANVKYSGANIGKELASIAGFLNGGSALQNSSGITNILKLTGNIAVKNGIAQTNDLQAQLDIGNVGLAGTASLISEALNLHATAVISQSVSQKVGGQSVGGFMKTALANNQGELVIPALVTGTFSKPKFEPDVQQLAQMKLKGLIPNINNPAFVASTLQNLLGGPRNPAETPQQQVQQEPNTVQQILGLFGKKKQDNEQQQQK